MASRRSLGHALSVTPEQKSFITGASTTVEQPTSDQPVIPTPTVAFPTTPKDTEEPEGIPEPLTESVPSHAQPRRTRSKARVEKDVRDSPHLPGLATLMMNISTRLQPHTGAALRKAVLEQRLQGAKPATVQEIVEIAVKGWLDENGYLE